MKNTSIAIRRRQRPLRTKLFMFIFVVTLVLVVLNQVFVNIASQQEQVYNQQVSDLRVLSQELAKSASSVAAGEREAFSSLEELKGNFQYSWSLINEGRRGFINTGIGFSTTLPGQKAVIDKAYPDIRQLWTDVSGGVDIILGNREKILEINLLADGMLDALPEVQKKYNEVAEALQAANQPLATVAVAQRQAWLAERIALNLNLIVAGESTAAQVTQFQQDIRLFTVNHRALQQGDSSLGVTRVGNAGSREALAEISSLFQDIPSGADSIITAVPVINGTTAAVSKIAGGSEILRDEITGLGDIFVIGGGLQIATPATGYALLLVLLLTISIYGQEVIKQSKEAEKFTAEKNSRNNEAVLKLLSEISSLADGDLTVKATVGEDFTGAIADSINYAIDQLRELVSAITSVTMEVTSSTESSMQTVESLSEASKRQTNSINSVHASIREIGDGINQVNENAQKTLDVAKNSVKTAVGGAEVVKDTIKGMDNIRDQIQDTAKRIKRLGESSQEIGGFVSLINDIAEHTNTLSLNAAIQAAMAGDAGKGFAVVADEVHALAERSGDATRQIESLVKVIQGDIKEAVQSMEQTTAEVVSGTRLAQSAGKALDEIQKVSKELEELVDSITDASQNQTKAASEITESMDVIQQVTSNTSSGIEATTEFMTKLGGLTERLQNAVAGFSLEDRKKDKWAKFKTDNVTNMDDKKVLRTDDDKTGESAEKNSRNSFSASALSA